MLLLELGACASTSSPPDTPLDQAKSVTQRDAESDDQPRIYRATMVNQSERLGTLPADEYPSVAGIVEIRVEGEHRLIIANGIPSHRIGSHHFPITEQAYEIRIPAKPTRARASTPVGEHDFGIAINGVPFAPGTGYYYLDDRNGGWHYDGLAGALNQGIDSNFGHVKDTRAYHYQGPTGAYHYHGLPMDLLTEHDVRGIEPSPIIGWAADGFPIYAVFGHRDPLDPSSPVEGLASSYVLREGSRPRGEGQPGGYYDGTFTADYEFRPGVGDLDECNGREVVTKEFPSGTYAYFLTTNWPVIPRCFVGVPHLW